MHRPHRHLDCKRQQEGDKYQLLLRHAQWHLHEREEIERACLCEQINERNQHQHRAEEGVQEELDGRVNATLSTPDADDEKHGNEHRFPHDVEQHAIERRENTDHQAFEYQKRRKILCRPRADVVPARDDDERRDKCRQQNQRRRDAVNAQVIMNIESWNPLRSLDELHRGGRGVEVRVNEQAQYKRQHADQ